MQSGLSAYSEAPCTQGGWQPSSPAQRTRPQTPRLPGESPGALQKASVPEPHLRPAKSCQSGMTHGVKGQALPRASNCQVQTLALPLRLVELPDFANTGHAVTLEFQIINELIF